MAAELIVTAALGGFSKFGKKFETYYDLLAALDKLGELIDLPLERLGVEMPVSTCPAGVEIRDVAGDRRDLRSSLSSTPSYGLHETRLLPTSKTHIRRSKSLCRQSS